LHSIDLKEKVYNSRRKEEKGGGRVQEIEAKRTSNGYFPSLGERKEALGKGGTRCILVRCGDL